ncbi:hypothetical protein ACLKA7_014410 [Drosophila subpalustris]
MIWLLIQVLPEDAQTSLSDAIAAAEAEAATAQATPPGKQSTIEPSVRVKCLSGSMLISIKDAPPNHETGLFSGMIYPKGLSKNSTCLSEYRDHSGPLRYKLPLRSCNTMPKETTLEDALCVSQRTFAIAIAIAGLILMLAVVAAVLCIMARRSTKTVSNSGSSIYSGPYTNTAFSHSS